jgi:hypothetical protein
MLKRILSTQLHLRHKTPRENICWNYFGRISIANALCSKVCYHLISLTTLIYIPSELFPDDQFIELGAIYVTRSTDTIFRTPLGVEERSIGSIGVLSIPGT